MHYASPTTISQSEVQACPLPFVPSAFVAEVVTATVSQKVSRRVLHPVHAVERAVVKKREGKEYGCVSSWIRMRAHPLGVLGGSRCHINLIQVECEDGDDAHTKTPKLFLSKQRRRG